MPPKFTKKINENVALTAKKVPEEDLAVSTATAEVVRPPEPEPAVEVVPEVVVAPAPKKGKNKAKKVVLDAPKETTEEVTKEVTRDAPVLIGSREPEPVEVSPVPELEDHSPGPKAYIFTEEQIAQLSQNTFLGGFAIGVTAFYAARTLAQLLF